LQGYLNRWEAEMDHGERKGPFDQGAGRPGVNLTGADVSWLATQTGLYAFGRVPNLHLERANLPEAHLEGAVLGEAHLERANFRAAHLEGAMLVLAKLTETNLNLAHLEQADLRGAWFDSRSALNNANFDNRTQLGDI
jgi:uncharacterized protein YjbI with pentapeptide repeats